jgi:tetratricopeptide (TPR) repeat protein
VATKCDSSAEPDRLAQVLFECLQAVEAGDSAHTLRERYPEYATEITEFLADRACFEDLAAPLREAVQGVSGWPADGPEVSLPEAGRWLGEFELLGVIGRGGMGTVYRARQRSLGRLVALKTIRADGPADPADVRRFRTEAEVVAGLEHPHIVPVYEVGEQAGVVYLSMRLVEGGNLAERLDRFVSDPRAAARLVADVARAVHFVHQRGVLHRDLKPANILLDADGRPLVTDFGLARRLDGDSSLTQLGAVVGTPSYAAPEQASGAKGAVTTAADVYGLGTVLYALLTGRPPFRGETVLATLELVRTSEPGPPRQLNPRVDRDLETICLKCLAKDPDQRYASAADLGEDLERWLRAEPVKARRAGRWERARKWVRRNPVWTALLTAVAVSAGAGMSGLVWHNHELQAEAANTARARDAARKSQRAARRAVNEMYTRVAEELLTDTPHLSEVQQEFLTKALEFYEEVVTDPGAEPEDRLELGRALSRIASLNTGLGRSQAEANYRESVRVLEALVAEYPGVPEFRLELVRSYNGLGSQLVSTDQFPEAKAVLATARTEAEGMHQGDPERPEYPLELATALGHLGEFFRRSNQLPEARDALVRSRDQARWLVDHWPAVRLHRESLARRCVNLGMVLSEMNCLSEAEESFLQARDQFGSLMRESPTRSFPRMGLAATWELLGSVLLAAGKVEEAEKAASQSVDLRRKLQDDFLRDLPWEWQAGASAHGFHAAILARLGRFREARAALVEAVPLMAKVAEVTECGRRWEEFATLEGNLAWLYLRQRAADNMARELLPRLQRARTKAPAGEQFRLILLGLAHYRLGDWDQSLTVLRQAHADHGAAGARCRWTTDDSEIRKIAEHQEEVAPAVQAFCLAMAYHRLGRPTEARESYQVGLRRIQDQRTPPGFRSVDVETLRAEAEDLLGLRE